MMNKVFLLILILFSSCSKSEKIVVVLPSKKYSLVADMNKKNEGEKRYGCVLLKVFDNPGRILDSLQTGASVYQTWAAGWHSTNDTIVLCSSDIGTYAYGITENGKLNNISVTLKSPLKAMGDTIFKRKYGYVLGGDN